MSLLSGKKLLLLGFVVVLLVIIPLTVYLVQQQQKLRVGAQKASTLSLVNTTTKASSATLNNATDTASFDVMLDPSTNQVSLVKLVVNFDATKLKVISFDPNTSAFPTTLQAASFTTSPASLTVSIGQNSTSFVQSVTKVATIVFGAQAGASPGSVQIVFDQSAQGTQVLSIAGTDQFNENVLNSVSPATITIAQVIAGGTPTPTPTPSPTPVGATPTPVGATPTPTPVGNAQVPVCTALNLDKQPTGSAPYTINFTAIGNEPGGTITKVSFNWGDGPIQNVTETGSAGGGVGTSSVNTQLIHTYNNPGSFTATATLTDSNGNVSAIGPCTKAITISAASTTAGGGSGGTGTTQVATVGNGTAGTAGGNGTTTTGTGTTTKGGLPAAGPGDKIISVGTLGIITTIIGALLLFGL